MERHPLPDWARDAVWYQIFPERFRNGCPASNPEVEDFSAEPIPGWEVTRWGMDWYRKDDWEKTVDPGGRQAVFHRRYGGDLVGVRDQLDYLQELGVNAIYLNPVFQAQSLHKYDATCFHHIDPAFGPDRAGDLRRLAEAGETEDPDTWIWTAADLFFTELVHEMHRRNMRVIIDGVFNHTGCAFFAFQDMLKNGADSVYRDWHTVERWHRDGTFDYRGWFGVRSLPEFGREDGNLTAPVRNYLFNITRRWMDPHGDGDLRYGVDGWRLDVAFCVPHRFWKDWSALVKQINPEAYTTGEVVNLATEFLQGDELDAVMNYMWVYPMLSYFIRGTCAISATACRLQLQALLDAYPPEVNGVLQNLLDSHDTGRILSTIANPNRPKKTWDDYFAQFRLSDHPDLFTRQPGEAEKACLRQVVIMQMTYLGAPMIYYGTEVGMWGVNDPDDRQPMLWDDVAYDQTECLPDGGVFPVLRAPDRDLFAFYRRAIALRRDHAALRRGELHWWTKNEAGNVLGFVRSLEQTGEEIAVLFNVREEAVSVELPFAGLDLWRNQPITATRQDLPPHGWLVVRRGEG